ncbi:MAG TPA: hypothetical protein VGE42_01330, partial [Candidatus Dormibacteraeota bacterium]
MTQLLSAAGVHAAALLVYPGLITLVVAGVIIEAAWSSLSRGSRALPVFRIARPQIVHVAIALLAVLAVVQTAAPFNPVPPLERNVIVAVAAL